MTAPILADEIAALRECCDEAGRIYRGSHQADIARQNGAESPLTRRARNNETLLRSALARLEAMQSGRRSWFSVARWRHRKRGSEYEILTSTAAAQCATAAINEGDHVTVYQGDDGSWWVRKTAEFQDGRFERIDALPPEPQEG